MTPHDRSHADHDHSYAGLSHAADDAGSARRLGLAAALTGGFMAVEVVGGVVSGSLALIADAGHMATDFASLVVAWYGLRLASRPADAARSYGYGRFSVLAAYTNGVALFLIAAWIVVEAAGRLASPVPVAGSLMFGVAAAGLAVNVVAFLILHRGDRSSLNIRAAALHVVGDLLGSVAALAAAVVIMTTGWTPIDPILSVFVALIILRSAWAVVADAGHILLEGTPEGADPGAIASDLAKSIDGIESVHHVHAWSLSERRAMATLHVRLGSGADAAAVVAATKARLVDRFAITHATVEVERGDGPQGSCPAGHGEHDHPSVG